MSGLLSGMMRPEFCQELGGSSIPNILGSLVHIPKAPSIVGQRETFLMLDTTNIHTYIVEMRNDGWRGTYMELLNNPPF